MGRGGQQESAAALPRGRAVGPVPARPVNASTQSSALSTSCRYGQRHRPEIDESAHQGRLRRIRFTTERPRGSSGRPTKERQCLHPNSDICPPADPA